MVTIGNPAQYVKINLALQAHFDKVAAKLNPADKITVAFLPATPAPTTTDILIYFAPVEFSLVANFAGRKHDPLQRMITRCWMPTYQGPLAILNT